MRAWAFAFAASIAGCGDSKSGSTPRPSADAAAVAAKPAEATPKAAPEEIVPPGMEEIDLSKHGQPVKLYVPIGATVKKARNTFKPALDITAPNGFSLRIGSNSSSLHSMSRMRQALEKEGGETITAAEQGQRGWLLRHHARGEYSVQVFRKDVQRFCIAHARRDADLEPMIASCRTMRPASVPEVKAVFSDDPR